MPLPDLEVAADVPLAAPAAAVDEAFPVAVAFPPVPAAFVAVEVEFAELTFPPPVALTAPPVADAFPDFVDV